MKPPSTNRRRLIKVTAPAAALLIAFSVLTACSGPTPGPDGAEVESTLTVSTPSDVSSLDPQLQGDMTSMSVAYNIFDTLTTRDADSKLAPGLATEWEATDPLNWRFTIREGVKFHNGEPLNAEAVAFSINRMLDPATKSPIVELINVQEAKVVDDTTVDFVMKAPDPIIPAKVSLFGGVIVPPKYIQEEGDAALAENPIGTGPFKFVSRKQANEIVLKANDDYWGEKPKVDNLIFKVMPDPAASLAALQSGGVDIVTGVTKDATNQLEGNPDTKVVSTPGIRTYSVNLDTITEGPLANADVRAALNYAVDVPTLIETVMGGAAERTPTMIPSSVFGFDESVKPFTHDAEKARELLADAGYPDGFSTSITASATDSTLAQAISGQLAEVGVNAEVQIVDATTAKSDVISLNKRLDGGMYLVANSGWTLDSVSFLQSPVKSDRRSSRWDNAEADELIVTGETSVEEDVRLEAFSKMQDLLKAEAPFIYLFNINNTYAMRSNVDWTMPPAGILDMSTATVE